MQPMALQRTAPAHQVGPARPAVSVFPPPGASAEGAAYRLAWQANPHAGGWVALPPSAAGTGVADRTTGAERGDRTLQRLPAAATALAALDLDGTLQSPSLVAEARFNVPSRHDHRVAPACCKRQLLPVTVPMASRRSRARSSQARSGTPHTARRSGESSHTHPGRALTTVLAACVEGSAGRLYRIRNCGASLGSIRAAGPRQPAQPKGRRSACAGYQHPALHAPTPRGRDPRGPSGGVDPYPCTGRRAAGARRHDRLGSCDHSNERATWA